MTFASGNSGKRVANVKSAPLALVTGGNGYIGQHLVAALVARDRQVRVLDVAPPRRALPEVEYVGGSVLDPALLDDALEAVDEVYHLAGLPGMWLPRKGDFHAVNYGGTEAVIMAARKRGIRRFLHCSTESILFRARASDQTAHDALLPTDDMPGPYTHSKMLADSFAMQAAASGFPVVIGCPTMPIGAHDHNFTPPTAMLRHFLRPRIQFYLDFPVNLVDVRDVATGLILAMERGKVGHRYVLGCECMALKQILQLMAEITGRERLLIGIPARVAEPVAAMMEFIADHLTRRPPSGTAEAVRIAQRARALPIEKAQRELGYAPGPIEPALSETIAYLSGEGDTQSQCSPGDKLSSQSLPTRRFSV